MKKRKILCLVLVAVSLVLCVIGAIILPDTVVVQIGVDGSAGNTMPKLLAIAIPFGLTLIGSFFSWTIGGKKTIFVSVIGVLMGMIMLLFNR